MIPKSAKLPLRTNYFNFKKTSKKVSNEYFTLYYKKDEPTQVGVVISKKVHKLASSRNQLKRIALDTLYEIAKDNGLSVLLIFTKPTPPNQLNELIREILKS